MIISNLCALDGSMESKRRYLKLNWHRFEQALQAGAAAVTQMTNLAFGDRAGRVRDPLGNIWWIHQRLEEVDYEEMSKRAGQKEYIEAMKYVQESLKLR